VLQPPVHGVAIAAMDLRAQVGDIDIYWLDQLLRGRVPDGARVLDAGCGGGRNLRWLLAAGYDVCGVDADPRAIVEVRRLAAALAPAHPEDAFRVERIEDMSVADASVNVVICSAVLHFARGHAQFEAMLASLWRVLRPGGVLFCRLASSIGMADRMRELGDGRFRLPDGTERYLVDEARLRDATARLGGRLLDPLKTTIVADQRCMTTWVLAKEKV